MVPLHNGQAIIGGTMYEIQFISCLNMTCRIITLSQTLSTIRKYFVAIPIPDASSECITGRKND